MQVLPITKDFLDELIEDRKQNDPAFASKWGGAELQMLLAGLRREAGLSQAEMAEKMQVSHPRVVELERHPEKVSFGRIQRYIEAAGGSFAVLSSTIQAPKGRKKLDRFTP